MGEKLCPKCGKRLPETAFFCAGCGTVFQVKEPEQHPSAGVTQPMEPALRTSQPAENGQTTQPPAPSRPSGMRCPQCGRPVSGQEEECPHCGLKFHHRSPEERRQKDKAGKKKPKKKKVKQVVRDKQYPNQVTVIYKERKRHHVLAWLLAILIVIAAIVAAFFALNPDARSWLMTQYHRLTGSTSQEIAQEVDLVELYGRHINAVYNELGEPARITQKEDETFGQVQSYDYQRFVLDINQEERVVSAYVHYSGLEDKVAVSVDGVNGNDDRERVISKKGEPDREDQERNSLIYYPRSSMAVEYQFDSSGALTDATVTQDTSGGVTDEDSSSAAAEGFELDRLLGRDIDASVAELGEYTSNNENYYGGVHYVFPGIVMETDQSQTVQSIAVTFAELNGSYLLGGVDGSFSRDQVTNEWGNNGTENGNTWTFQKNGCSYSYEFDSSGKLLYGYLEFSAS